jgi:hypothetical protein
MPMQSTGSSVKAIALGETMEIPMLDLVTDSSTCQRDAAGYATDPDYSQKIIAIIKAHNLSALVS